MGYVSSVYCDTRPIYMPPLAKELMKKIQKNIKKKNLKEINARESLNIILRDK